MRTLTGFVVVLLAGSPVCGQFAVEISEDGRAAADVSRVDAARGTAARGSTLPFGLTPDFEVHLRRQIGGLAIADMNGDGLNDLVAVCYISSSFPPYEDWHDMIFYNTPAGLSTAPGWLSANETHTGDVQIGDINGDGLPDLVAVHGGSVRADAVQVYFGTGNGPSPSPGYSSNIPGRAWGTAGAIVDIDLDGDLDLVTTNQAIAPDPFRPVMLFRNGGAGLGTAPDWESGADEISNGVVAADILGGDGLPELITAKWVNFNSGVYENIGGTPGAFPFMAVAADSTDKGAAVGDINGDGVPEVAFGGDPMTVYETSGGVLTPLWVADPPFGGSQEIRMHDADGDGDLDMAEVIFSDGKAHIYQNNNGVLDTQPTWTFDAPEVGTSIVFGDLNGDGRDDLAVGYSGDTCIRVFYAEAPPCPADLTGDGILDLADVQAFVSAFTSGNPAADLAEPFGVLDLADVQAFISSFVAGCP